MKYLVALVLLLAVGAMGLSSCRSTAKQPTNNKNVESGGWGEYHDVTGQALTAWKQVQAATDTIADLTPISVRTQVVGGYNFDYKCRDKQGKTVEVSVFDQLDGTPQVTYIKR